MVNLLVFWSGCLNAFGNVFLAKSRDHTKKAKVLQLGTCCKEVVRGRGISGSPPVGITLNRWIILVRSFNGAQQNYML